MTTLFREEERRKRAQTLIARLKTLPEQGKAADEKALGLCTCTNVQRRRSGGDDCPQSIIWHRPNNRSSPLAGTSDGPQHPSHRPPASAQPRVSPLPPRTGRRQAIPVACQALSCCGWRRGSGFVMVLLWF